MELEWPMEPSMKDKILDVFKDSTRVKLAYLFGSRVDGVTGPLSDYDFAVLMDKKSYGSTAYALLVTALSQTMQVDRVDVVLLEQAPIELAYSIIAQGEVLYEHDIATRVEYESGIMGLYGDYLPVLRKLRSDLLKGDQYAARVQRYRKALGRTARTLSEIGAL